MSSLTTWTEKGIVQYRTKHGRANTKRLSIYWQEDGYNIKRNDTKENELAKRELVRLVASGGASEPLWTKEKDLISMTKAGKTFVQFEMRLRNCQLNSQQQQNEDKE